MPSDWSEILEIVSDQTKGRKMQLLHSLIAGVTSPLQLENIGVQIESDTRYNLLPIFHALIFKFSV